MLKSLICRVAFKMDNRVGNDCGSGGGLGGGGQRGENWGNCNRITIKFLIKKEIKNENRYSKSFWQRERRLLVIVKFVNIRKKKLYNVNVTT